MSFTKVISGEGPAEFFLQGGRSEASIFFGPYGKKITDDEGDVETVIVQNHKGDLTIEIPHFDMHVGFVITIRGDHSFRVEQLKPEA